MKKFRQYLALFLALTLTAAFPAVSSAADKIGNPYVYGARLIRYAGENPGTFLVLDTDVYLADCVDVIEIHDSSDDSLILESGSPIFETGKETFSPDGNYYARIPVEAFSRTMCRDRNITVPHKDVIFEFSGEELFAEDFKPFFQEYLHAPHYFYGGNPCPEECRFYRSHSFGKEMLLNENFTIAMPVTFTGELKIRASYDSDLSAETERVRVNGLSAEIDHYNGCIYFGLFDTGTGECYDKIYIETKSDRNNPAETVDDLMNNTQKTLNDFLNTALNSVKLIFVGIISVPVKSFGILFWYLAQIFKF